MFTGLVQAVGKIESLERCADTWELAVRHAPWEDSASDGESIAVQGACLTVARSGEGRFVCNVLDETLSRTSLASRGVGAEVNLERALRLGDRLGGHLVAGHVDGVGRVQSIMRAGADWVLRIGCDAALCREMVAKGSIACDGVSLTLTDVGERAFEVHIIPVSWTGTTLHALREGDPVNIETDLIAKYVLKAVSAAEQPSGLRMEDLQRAGFLRA